MKQTLPSARGILAAATLLAAQCAGAAQLVIAQVAPLSGLEAIQGRAYSVGLQLAFNNANKGGGVGGHTFSLVRKDDGGRPEDTITVTNQVLGESKPIALAGYFGNRSIAELVKSGILEKEKIALVGYRTTEIRPDVPYLYSVRAGLRDEINKIAEHLVTVGITRLGLFHEDGPGAAAVTAASRAGPASRPGCAPPSRGAPGRGFAAPPSSGRAAADPARSRRTCCCGLDPAA